MHSEPQDSLTEQTNLPQQETQTKQPSTDSALSAMVKRYGFTPQQVEEMSLYL